MVTWGIFRDLENLHIPQEVVPLPLRGELYSQVSGKNGAATY